MIDPFDSKRRAAVVMDRAIPVDGISSASEKVNRIKWSFATEKGMSFTLFNHSTNNNNAKWVCLKKIDALVS
jgi:hypothetical protein